MKISPGQNPGTPVDPPSSPAKPAKDESVSTLFSSATNDQTAATTGGTSTVAPLERQTEVTYRQDSNGRVYYSVSDAKSGQEILEIPPKMVRDVSQGIEDYVKQEQSKAGSHVEVKA